MVGKSLLRESFTALLASAAAPSSTVCLSNVSLVDPKTLSRASRQSIPRKSPALHAVIAIALAEPTMKSLIFERGLNISGEHIVLTLFKTARGFTLERRVIERDQTASVQVLPITAVRDLHRFESADPYSAELAPLYYEVRRHLLENRVVE
jgi:hypothetical protein